MRRVLAAAAASLLVLTVPVTATADHVDGHWAEGQDGSGDAGDMPGDAQNTVGFGDLMEITGNIEMLSSSLDVDMYRIFIANPALFSATTVGTDGTLANTQLFLFNQAGLGVLANDDADVTTQRSLIPVGSIGMQPPGFYLLAISSFDRDPVSAGGLIFPSIPTTGVFGPTGPGGGLPLIGYQTLGDQSGTYTIQLTGAQFAVQRDPGVIPEPSTLTLLGLGALGLLWVARRRK